MTNELELRRKWTFRAHGRQVVCVKKSVESTEHVVMKALLWALYLPDYPGLTVEAGIGDRYKPDVVELDAQGEPRFWGEAGSVRAEKIRSLTRRYRFTHFAIAKWDMRLDPVVELVRGALEATPRRAPFDIIRFPTDSATRFIDDQGYIYIAPGDLEWVRLG